MLKFYRYRNDKKHYVLVSSVDRQYFFHESFTPAAPATDTPAQANPSMQPVNIRVPAYEQTLAAHAGDVLADVLEQGQLPIIIACRSGICGSCKCKVNHGKVSSTSQSPLTTEEIEQGYVLACSSTIESDLDIQIG
ncbi:2Fe-2S iron-sulfur cluster-binding protein [Celerinatantimonas diazotrophica]|uniref:2Fe-2S iron-sulfur cluster-binding protein n=1 Tax=Celerinatantimonas diazotrophica TaxID=412034 RepID=UPI0010488603|nr:NADH oxidoreductase HCR [Celerinatantimonas diazotrophica]